MHPEVILADIHTYRYLALFVLGVVEGPIVALVAGFLVRIGILSLGPTCLVLVFADLPDSLCYAIGRFGTNTTTLAKYPKIMKLRGWIDALWHEHPTKAMFVSKLAYGLSLPLLITAGMSRMPYKDFIWRAIVVTAFQYGVLLAVGYGLGNAYDSAGAYVKEVQIGIAIIGSLCIAGFFFAQTRIKKFVQKHETN